MCETKTKNCLSKVNKKLEHLNLLTIATVFFGLETESPVLCLRGECSLSQVFNPYLFITIIEKKTSLVSM